MVVVVAADHDAPWKGARVAEFLGSSNTDYRERQDDFPFSKFSYQQTGNETNLDPSLFFLYSSAKLP